MPMLTKVLSENDMLIPSWQHPVAIFFSTSRPNIETHMFVQRMLRYANCSRSAFIIATVYLTRLAAAQPYLALNQLNVHRLFITALLLAAKYIDDTVFSNAHYARIAGIVTVQELNRLEVNMLHFLSFRTFVSPHQYADLVHQLSRRRMPFTNPSLCIRIPAKLANHDIQAVNPTCAMHQATDCVPFSNCSYSAFTIQLGLITQSAFYFPSL